MVLLNEMAAAWNSYLSIGVILICSNGAFSLVPNSTKQNGQTNFHVTSQNIGGRNLEQTKRLSVNSTKITNLSTDLLAANESFSALSKATVVKNEITVSSSQPRFDDAIYFTEGVGGSINGHQSTTSSKSEYFITNSPTVSFLGEKEKAHANLKDGFLQKHSLASNLQRSKISEEHPTMTATATANSERSRVVTERIHTLSTSRDETQALFLQSSMSSRIENTTSLETPLHRNSSSISSVKYSLNNSTFSALIPNDVSESPNKFESSFSSWVTSPTKTSNGENSSSAIGYNRNSPVFLESSTYSTVSSIVVPKLPFENLSNFDHVTINSDRNSTVFFKNVTLNSNTSNIISLLLPENQSATSFVLQRVSEGTTPHNFRNIANMTILLAKTMSDKSNISSKSTSVDNATNVLSPDYQDDVYDVFTEDYVTSVSTEKPPGCKNVTEPIDIPSLRKKFMYTFVNLTSTVGTTELPSTSFSVDFKKTSINQVLPTDGINLNIKLDYRNSSYVNVLSFNNSEDLLDLPSSVQEIVTSAPFNYSVTSVINVTANNTSSLHKEQLQFPGITLKVSHMLIPKQKRSRYNIKNMRIELPKAEGLNRSPPTVPKTLKNPNCTRFPMHVVTADDSESKEKVNLTEEHYDCEFSSEIQSTRQKEPVDSIRTFYGRYVFRYAIPIVSTNSSVVVNQSSTETTKLKTTTAFEENYDYYSSYVEYLDSTNGTNKTVPVDRGLFPDPTVLTEKFSSHKTEVYSPPATDTNSIDSDLHDHDVIDSVMYIYFGGAPHGQRGAGRQIIIVGAVIALVAQFLTLASSIRRIKTHQGEEPTIILLNVEVALTLTNLIFILGVQSTSNHTMCKLTAVSLYYLHIATLFWFLLSSVYSVQIVCQINTPFKFYVFCMCGWLLPFIKTMLGYFFNERSFETNSYCWVSPLRGVLFSYILPVIFLCVICIVLTVYGLRRVTDTTEDFDDTYSHRKLLRISAVALPLFSVIWFTGMVALENSTSLLFSMIFLISNTVLNWLLFGCWLPSEASQWKDMDEDYYDDEDDFDDEAVLPKRRFDDQPLLSELYEYSTQGQLYNLRVEPISIISAP